MKAIRTAILLLFSTLGTACKDTPTGPPPVATVSIAAPAASIVSGTSQTLVATVRAPDGSTLTGRQVFWTSSQPLVGVVSPVGEFSAISPGTTDITATVEGKTAVTTLTVLPVPVATVLIAGMPEPLLSGVSVQLVAILRDAQERRLLDRAVQWTSSNASVATITSTGLFASVAPGNVTISATSEGKSDSLVLTVLAQPDAPVITAIVPAQLTPGAQVTVTGLGFSSSVTSNRVTVRGVNAQLVAGTTTQLTFIVPCVNSGTVPVVVTTSERASAPKMLAMSVVSRTLAVGQSLVLGAADSPACNELLGGSPDARYIVAVFSGSTSQNTLTNFEFGGNTPAPGSTLSPVRVLAPLAEARALSAEEERNAKLDRAHYDHLERERVAFAEAQRYERARVASAKRAPVRSARSIALPVIGDEREFYLTLSGGCNDVSRPVATKAIYVGTRAIIWEDTTNVLLSSKDTELAGYYRRMGQIFDEDQYDVLVETFGDPLLRDHLTDADGRIHMVFTQKLNATGAAAYVTSCDQVPRTTAAGSNFGEVFYGVAPIAAGSNPNNTSFPDGWFNFMGRTVIHEVKHIVSVATRVQNNAPFESGWLEEGTARHAEEVWVRKSLHKVAWKGNTGYGTAATNGIYCDFHPSEASCLSADLLRRPSYGMRRQFNEIRDKLIAPWNWSPYGDGAGQGGSVFYQTAWSLVRYTIDRYASSDEAFFKSLINSFASGANNLVVTSGANIDQLIGSWGLALYTDDYPGLSPTNADLQFPTWNLRSIYAGLNASPAWTARFNNAFPIQPTQTSFGSFSFSQSGLRGGAHAYYEISGAAPAVQLLSIRGQNGAAVSPNARLAIARLR